MTATVAGYGSGNLTLKSCRAVTDRKPYRHRFPLSVIVYALWLYHRFPLIQRDVQELLHERGIHVSHETLRQWNIKFAPLLTEELRHQEPRRGSRWHLDEAHVVVSRIKHWLWRAVDEQGAVLDILLQEHRDTEAAKTLFTRLLGEYDVPEAIHTDKLWCSNPGITCAPRRGAHSSGIERSLEQSGRAVAPTNTTAGTQPDWV